MRLIYLSPHLDDAALSAGGFLFDQARAGRRVEIWTLMCGIPPSGDLSAFAVEMHARWGTASARHSVRARRIEDQRAAQRIGARAVHFDFLDAIYRRGEDGSWLYADPVRASVHAADGGLPGSIAGALARRLESGDRLICQLAIGHHVDHVVVRRAAESLRRPLLYAADIPYALQHPEDLAARTKALQYTVQPVSADGLTAWLESIAAYASQLSSVYPSWEQLRVDLRRFVVQLGGLRLWSARRVPPGGA